MKTLKGMKPECLGTLTGWVILLAIFGSREPMVYVGPVISIAVAFVTRWMAGL